MERSKMYETIHTMRACAIGQYEGKCDHKCLCCMYRVNDEDILELLDDLCRMYRPKKTKKAWFKRKGA